MIRMTLVETSKLPENKNSIKFGTLPRAKVDRRITIRAIAEM